LTGVYQESPAPSVCDSLSSADAKVRHDGAPPRQSTAPAPNLLSHLQNHREQAAISPDAGFVLSALQCGTVWSTFGYGRDEDFDFRTRRDRGGLVLIQFFGFLLTAYVMSLRI